MEALIGLAGYAQAGKDTAAAMLAGHGFERVAFADNVRHMLWYLDPMVTASRRLSDLVSGPDHAGDWHAAKKLPEVRALLQRLGTEAGRAVLGPTIWTDTLFAKLDPARAYVVTDVRFPNEAEAVRDRGGMLVRVDRPGCRPVNGHISETALDGWRWDAVLRNGGTIAELDRQVHELVSVGVRA